MPPPRRPPEQEGLADEFKGDPAVWAEATDDKDLPGGKDSSAPRVQGVEHDVLISALDGVPVGSLPVLQLELVKRRTWIFSEEEAGALVSSRFFRPFFVIF